jgi:hypothetical protein
MNRLNEIRARWDDAEPWVYDEQNHAIVNPARLEGKWQTPQWVAQLFDRFEENLPDHEINGPRIATAPEDIKFLLQYVEQLREAAIRVVTDELVARWSHLHSETELRWLARDLITSELYDVQNPPEEEGDDAEG